eukprot:6325998-Amphidinium_carterae.1
MVSMPARAESTAVASTATWVPSTAVPAPPVDSCKGKFKRSFSSLGTSQNDPIDISDSPVKKSAIAEEEDNMDTTLLIKSEAAEDCPTSDIEEIVNNGMESERSQIDN